MQESFEQVFSVTQFNEMVNHAIKDLRVWVQGEISGYRVSRGKWVTFDLKDEGSKVNVFTSVYQLDQVLEDGMEVKVYGYPRIYVPYGKYSFNLQRVEPVGEGALRRAFELTKQKLEQEGLFTPEAKKPIPRFPQTIGIVTSEEAAAYTDFLRILNNRWRGVETILRPALVQGTNAPDEIVEALEWFNKYHPVDVLVLTRGGGSLEDLMAFNSEAVCRAMFSSNIPIVCGVGHERDVTLAELVADQRASTPSNAAEQVVPDREEIAWQLNRMEKSMRDMILSTVAEYHWDMEHLLRRIEGTLRQKFDRFRQLEHDLKLAVGAHLRKMEQYIDRLRVNKHQLHYSMDRLVDHYKTRLTHMNQLMGSYNPKSVLKRGYSITRLGNGKVLSSVKEVKANETIQTELRDGSITSEVQGKSKKPIENKRLI